MVSSLSFELTQKFISGKGLEERFSPLDGFKAFEYDSSWFRRFVKEKFGFEPHSEIQIDTSDSRENSDLVEITRDGIRKYDRLCKENNESVVMGTDRSIANYILYCSKDLL